MNELCFYRTVLITHRDVCLSHSSTFIRQGDAVLSEFIEFEVPPRLFELKARAFSRFNECLELFGRSWHRRQVSFRKADCYSAETRFASITVILIPSKFISME